VTCVLIVEHIRLNMDGSLVKVGIMEWIWFGEVNVARIQFGACMP